MSVSEDLNDIVLRCASVLSFRPAGLLSDIDGTLSAIAPTPDSASVSLAAREALLRLSKQLDVVGTVSGRAAENSQAMIGVPELLYIGNHGLERRTDGRTDIHPLAAREMDQVGQILDIVHERTDDIPLFAGILLENKGVTASIHYRLAVDPEAARDALLTIVEPEAEVRKLKVTQGRMVIEIRPSVSINKGSSIEAVVEESGLRSLIFLGDDTTDIDGFRALSRLRDHGVIAGLNIAVVSPESPPAVALAADLCVTGVDSCVELLIRLAGVLEQREGR